MTGEKKFVGLALLICVLVLGGCGSAGGNGGTRTTKDVEKTASEKERAKVLAEIDLKFENPDAHFRLGQLYQADGLWARAENEYNITLSFDPVHRPAQAALVKVLYSGGNKDKAKLLSDVYINQASSSALASLNLGLAFQKQGLDEEAVSCYRQALHLAPNSAQINRQLGYYYLSKGDNTQAKEFLGRSFQLNPDQPDVAGELGRLGVAVKIPRGTETNTKALDKMMEQSGEKAPSKK